MIKALIIEDDERWRGVFRHELEAAHVQVEMLNSWSEGLDKLRNSRFYDLLILDLFEGEEPYPRGLGFLRKLRDSGNTIPVIVVTAQPVEPSGKLIRNLFHEYGILDYLSKATFSSDDLLKSINEVRAASNAALDRVKLICQRFHLAATQLLTRHDGRPPLSIKDEYDVQDLLGSFLT